MKEKCGRRTTGSVSTGHMQFALIIQIGLNSQRNALTSWYEGIMVLLLEASIKECMISGGRFTEVWGKLHWETE